MIVEELPIFAFNDSLITYDQPVILIGKDEADRCLESLHSKQWVVSKYSIGGMTVWIHLDVDHEGLKINHYYD